MRELFRTQLQNVLHSQNALRSQNSELLVVHSLLEPEVVLALLHDGCLKALKALTHQADGRPSFLVCAVCPAPSAFVSVFLGPLAVVGIG